MNDANFLPTQNSVKRYKRLILKLSGEILAGTDKQGISVSVVKALAKQIAEVHELGIELAIVIGGGNIFRGIKAASEGMDRATADYMGMMATIINGLALQDILEAEGLITRLQTAIEMKSIAEPFIRRKALRHLEKKRVVILAGGTGNPYFTTDTTAALRGVELGVDAIFKATKVDGVYEADPVKNPNAKKYLHLPYMEAIEKRLKVMDSTAFALCMDNKMPILIFDVQQEGNLRKAVEGEIVGTTVSANEGVIFSDVH